MTTYQLMYKPEKTRHWRACSIKGPSVKRAASPDKAFVEAERDRMAAEFPGTQYAILELNKEKRK